MSYTQKKTQTGRRRTENDATREASDSSCAGDIVRFEVGVADGGQRRFVAAGQGHVLVLAEVVPQHRALLFGAVARAFFGQHPVAQHADPGGEGKKKEANEESKFTNKNRMKGKRSSVEYLRPHWHSDSPWICLLERFPIEFRAPNLNNPWFRFGKST